MNPQATHLPPFSDQVNAGTLSRIFAEVTNSYKFLFFMGLLNKLEESNFASVTISLDDVVLEMLTVAWYPHCYFRLSFGRQDLVASELDACSAYVLDENRISPLDREAVRQSISRTASTASLKRYVPYRLIRPFFAAETRGLKDHQVNTRVAELAAEYFVSRRPPYKFMECETHIEVHGDWLAYFRQNLKVLRGWVSWEWLEYMQKCNPSIPGLATKLFPPQVRDSLKEQTKYWKAVLKNEDFRCIYSGNRIVLGDFSLDHFVPWSFVVHDQLWNLIPTSRAVNSQKSDCLPAHKYLDKFITMQHQGILVAREMLPKKWEKDISCFYEDLHLRNENELLDLDVLKDKYYNTIVPLIQLAEINGFVPDWEYQG
jgi:hypothetical protein